MSVIKEYEIIYKADQDLMPDIAEIYFALQEWGPCAPKTLEQMEERIYNGVPNGIIAGYINDDGVYKPAAILESIVVPADGLASFAGGYGKNFCTLTGGGNWSTNRTWADTKVLVDFTVIPEMRSRGVASRFLSGLITSFSKCQNLFTYSPKRPDGAAEKMHKKMGADHRMDIKNGRPGYVYEDVSVMVYWLASGQQSGSLP